MTESASYLDQFSIEGLSLPGTPVACADTLLRQLRSHADPDNVEGMARFGIAATGTLGVRMSTVRRLALEAKRSLGRSQTDKRHQCAAQLWASNVHEARILAALIDVAELVTPQQMDEWTTDFDSWDVCDQVCNNLFDKTAHAWDKAIEWAERDEEFVKRAGFVLMTQLAVHDKSADDERFLAFFPFIEREAGDPRNFVKKAVSWALRQIGKRSPALNAASIDCAQRILAATDTQTGTPEAFRAARWVARDALRELRSDAVRERLGLR